MENLKIINARGEIAHERDLADLKGPVLVVEKADKVELVDEVSSDDHLVGALLRTVDGWDLASSDPSSPVRSGPKASGSLPLIPGVSLALGSYVFVIDGAAAASGDVLVWRVGKSAPAADQLLPGRNSVAVDRITGNLTLNPALAKEVLFTFFLTDDGIETVAADGSHLAVPRRAKFACGDFEGVVLESSEAAAAVKTRDPFGYPSRGVRQQLLFWTVGAFALFAVAAKLHITAVGIERDAASAIGAERVAGTPAKLGVVHQYDSYIFHLSVLRDMPRVLGPRRTQIAADLISRAETLPDDPKIAETVAFIREVSAIQDNANGGLWDALRPIVDNARESTYAYFGAQAFLADSRALVQVFQKDLPDLFRQMMFSPVAELPGLTNRIAACVKGLDGNVFCGAESVRAFVDGVPSRQETAGDVAAWMDRLGGSVPLTADEILNLRTLLSLVAADFDEPAYHPSIDELRRRLAEYASREVKAALAKYEPGKSSDSASLALVAPLCDLAEDAGVDPARVAVGREKAREIGRLLEKRERELYQQYRLGGAMERTKALGILDEILAICGPNGKFRAWAMREKARLNGESEEKK